MKELMKFDRYADFKQRFDREYKTQTEGYIKMGYLLKVARDTDILKASGYKSIAEFAWNEYRIRDDAVSRMIDVNDRFSEGGYSERLDGKYQGYGASLLAEMITMSDAVIDALPQGITREVVREVKKEIREEGKVSDLEVLIEGQDSRQKDMGSSLAKVLHQYYRENVRIFPEMYKAMKTEGDLGDTALRILAPSGIGVKTVRIQGIGKFMISAKGRDQRLELVNIRTNEQETYSWEECAGIMIKMCEGRNFKEAFAMQYGIPYPEPEEGKPRQEREERTGNGADESRKEETAEERDKENRKDTKKTPEMPVNTGKEQECADTGEKEQDDYGDGDDTDDGAGAGKDQETPEAGTEDLEPDVEKPKIAPAQPEPGNEDIVEVIESPYREYVDDAETCLVQIRELLEEADFEAAYIVGQNLVSALNEMRKIMRSQDEQLAGQMELKNHIEG